MKRLWLLLLLAAAPAGSDGTNKDWFQSLKDKDGRSCCSIADCRTVPVTMDTKGVIWARLGDNKWVPVPQDKILNRWDNPTKSVIVCYQGETIFCVVFLGAV